MQIVLPCEKPVLRASATQRAPFEVSVSLPSDVEKALASLFEKEFGFVRQQERLKAELMSRFDYNVPNLFKSVDDWNYKYLDTKNIKRFLMKTGIYPDESLLKAIIRRLDNDGDARLSFKEFSDAV